MLTGVTQAFGTPAARALTPQLVPEELLASALALRSIAGQAATVTGPAAGGLLYALRPEAVYGTAAGLLVVSTLVLLAVPPQQSVPAGVWTAPVPLSAV